MPPIVAGVPYKKKRSQPHDAPLLDHIDVEGQDSQEDRQRAKDHPERRANAIPTAMIGGASVGGAPGVRCA